MKTIYNIIGYKGVGKDTVAGFLGENIYLSFAKPLKEVVHTLFQHKVLGLQEKLYGNIEEKEMVIVELPISDKLKLDNPFLTGHNYWTGRLLLQYFGSEVCREIYPNIWVDILIAKIQSLESIDSNIVLTDCRFNNEYVALKDYVENIANYKLIVIKVTRPEYNGDGHATEQVCDTFDYDYLIENKGTKDNLKDTIQNTIKEIK